MCSFRRASPLAVVGPPESLVLPSGSGEESSQAPEAHWDLSLRMEALWCLEDPENLTAPLGNTEHQGVRVIASMKAQDQPLYITTRTLPQ